MKLRVAVLSGFITVAVCLVLAGYNTSFSVAGSSRPDPAFVDSTLKSVIGVDAKELGSCQADDDCVAIEAYHGCCNYELINKKYKDTLEKERTTLWDRLTTPEERHFCSMAECAPAYFGLKLGCSHNQCVVIPPPTYPARMSDIEVKKTSDAFLVANGLDPDEFGTQTSVYDNVTRIWALDYRVKPQDHPKKLHIRKNVSDYEVAVDDVTGKARTQRVHTYTSITSPQDNTAQPASVPVFLQGSVFDADHGVNLQDTQLQWTSSLQGALGSGSKLQVRLKPGRHVIMLTGTTSEGDTLSESIHITIGGARPGITLTQTPERITPTTCVHVTINAAPGKDGTDLTSVQYSLDGGKNYITIPLASLPYTFLVSVPGEKSVHIVARAYDESQQSNAEDISFFVPQGCTDPGFHP